MAAVSCPLSGRMTVRVHLDSMRNAFVAGYRMAGGSPEELEKILDEENLWLHDPRAENGIKEKPLARTGSRGRPSGSGSAGNPCTAAKGGNNVDYANKPYNPECCARRFWNGGLMSEDGTQAGAQCSNENPGGEEGGLCANCQKVFEKSKEGKADWHGLFSKTIEEDPGSRKDGSSHPWGGRKKAAPKDNAEGTGLKKTSSKKKKEGDKPKKKTTKKKKAAKAEKAQDAEDKAASPAEKNKEVRAEKAQDAEDTAASSAEKNKEVRAEKLKKKPAEVEEPMVEDKKEEVQEDDSDIVELEGPDGKVSQFIHDTESDTLYTKEGEPVGNWVDGKAEWFSEDTEDMSDEEEKEESDEESDEESEDEE